MAWDACPACSASVGRSAADRIAHCSSCGHRWMPMTLEQQSRAEKAIYTRDYAGYRQDTELARNFDELISEVVKPRTTEGATILDVGCGGGAFLDAAKRAGFIVHGLDISEDAAQLCRERGHKAHSGDFLVGTDRHDMDIVTMWDVLEHLRSPAQFLAAAEGRLRPGGLFIAKVPTYGALSVTLSSLVPRLRRVLLGAPDHVQYYSQRSLRALFARSNLSTLEFRELAGGIRTAPTGGGWRKTAARGIKRAIARLSGEGNILVVAQATGH